MSATIAMFTGLTETGATVDARGHGRAKVLAENPDIEQIYRKYGGLVRRRCIKILGNEDDADDAAQDVFVRAMRSLGQFRKQASPATWLYRIATNVCLNRIRNSKTRERLGREHLLPPEPSSPVEAWPRDLVMRVLGQFDGATQEVVLYAVVEGMTYEEISEVTGNSVARVRKRMVAFKTKAPKRTERLLRGRA